MEAGDFGPVTITKPVTIDASGTQGGSISVGNFSSAILINIEGPGEAILRNLTIAGANFGFGARGIVVRGATQLVVDHCRISSLQGIGIDVQTGMALVTNSVLSSLGVGVNVSGVVSLNGTPSGNSDRTTYRSRAPSWEYGLPPELHW